MTVLLHCSVPHFPGEPCAVCHLEVVQECWEWLE